MKVKHYFIPTNTQLLVMCSSHRRPEKLRDLITSFYENRSEGTELIVYVGNDDPFLEKYQEILPNTNYIIDKPRNMVEVLNFLSRDEFPDMKYYQEVNDDHVIRTKAWDKLFIDASVKRGGWGWFYGWTQNYPTAVFATGNLVRAVGYFLPRSFTHTYVDNVIMQYAEIGLLHHVPEIMIEHMHHFFGKSERDSNVDYVESDMPNGSQKFEDWLKHQKDQDFQKIREAMKNNAQ